MELILVTEPRPAEVHTASSRLEGDVDQEGGTTWIVSADAAEVRIFAERVRAGPLRELPEQHMSIRDAERGEGRGQRGSVHQRAGAGRHTADRSPGQAAERAFLERVALQLAARAAQGAFDRLVLMGPPRALGVLKKALSPALAARVDVADAHAGKGDDAEALRRHLREARARTWAPERIQA